MRDNRAAAVSGESGILRRFLNLLYYAALILVIAAVFLMSNIGGDSARTFAGYGAFVVLSGSMEDTYPQGSLIVVKEVEANDLAVGDDITFLSPNTAIVTHRIVEIRENYNGTGKRAFRTQGTMNAKMDSDAVMPDNIIGRVIYCSPLLGKVVSFLEVNWPLVIFLIVVGAALIFVLKLLYRRLNEEEDEDGEMKTGGRGAGSTVPRKNEPIPAAAPADTAALPPDESSQTPGIEFSYTAVPEIENLIITTIRISTEMPVGMTVYMPMQLHFDRNDTPVEGNNEQVSVKIVANHTNSMAIRIPMQIVFDLTDGDINLPIQVTVMDKQPRAMRLPVHINARTPRVTEIRIPVQIVSGTASPILLKLPIRLAFRPPTEDALNVRVSSNQKKEEQGKKESKDAFAQTQIQYVQRKIKQKGDKK